MEEHPLYVISDVHIGDHGPRDNFWRADLPAAEGGYVSRPEQFRYFLNMVRDDGGRLVIIGDVFELWQANVGDVLSRNVDLLDELCELSSLDIILGNHDLDLLGLAACPALNMTAAHPIFSRIFIPGQFDADTPKIMTKRFGEAAYGFMHGNEIDIFNNSAVPGAGRAVAIFAGMIEDSVGGPFLPNSRKLVEEDLMDKVEEFKGGFLSFLVSSFLAKQNALLNGVVVLWVAAVIGTVISSFLNASWSFFTVGLIVLPLLFIHLLVKKVWSSLTNTATEVTGGLLEYVNIWVNNLSDCQSSVAHHTESAKKKDDMELERIMRKNACDMLMIGHTHVDDIGPTLCNSGNWINDRPSFLKIYPNGDVELYRWQAVNASEGMPVLRKRLRRDDATITQIEPFANKRL